jgi:hypothetical protein
MKAAPVSRGLGFALGTAVLGLVLHGCNSQSVDAKLRSLQASARVTFVCRSVESGLPRDRCPDLENDPPKVVLDALVTQTATDEIAIVDANHANVVDVDPSIPGYNFLRLPSRPGDIVTTPGGTASFVGLTSTGRTGISALPTDCLGPPRAAETAQGIPQAQRDVTTFPACTLPSAPGEMAVLVEPPAADGTVSATCATPTTSESTTPPGGTRYCVVQAGSAAECTVANAAACRAELGAAEGDLPAPVWIADAGECRQPNGRDCSANLTAELGPRGRRKLVVTLPDEGRVVVLDAQSILDRKPGSFDPCVIEHDVKLANERDASGQAQVLPPDLEPDPSCQLTAPPLPPVPASARSRPSGLAVSDGRLFVGDLGVPLVHVLDAVSACGLSELPSLLPMSVAHPQRLVTTSNVAVTPVTPAGKQYVYAVDANDQPTSSVMVFDVSEGSTDRTPIVRPGAPRQPREDADRLQFPAPVNDLTFALRDLPTSDPTTGVADFGTECDPDPTLPLDPPVAAAQYRTSADKTQGARPRLLRGLFALVLLANGQVYVVDVDDFDRPCRRPVQANPSMSADFRGCANDPDIGYYTYKLEDGAISSTGEPDGTPTVSNEVSCNMVEPHRSRSVAFGLADPSLPVGAPVLRALPRFDPPQYATSVGIAERPKLLAVPFAAPEGGEPVPPQVYVGTTLFQPSTESARLPQVPTQGEATNGLTLPPAEPRSYLQSDHNVLAYEGRVTSGDYPSGFFDFSGLSFDNDGRLDDPAAFFCGNNIYDHAAMTDYAVEVLGMKPAAAQAFAAGPPGDPAQGHADYVQITGDFPSLTDPYWQSARGLLGGGRQECLNVFGPPPGQVDDLQVGRDFAIAQAFQDHLMLRPRHPPLVTANLAQYEEGTPEYEAEKALLEEQVAARDAYFDKVRYYVAYCFPSGVRYTVRGSRQWVLANGAPAWLHDTVVDYANGNHCVRDCNPRKRWFRSRVFEIATTDTCGPGHTVEACNDSGVGLGTASDGACRYDPIGPDGPRGVSLDEPGGASNCIFENLTSRFAVYRGKEPSLRDMTFTWDQTGGFYPLLGSLAAQSTVVLPQSLAYVSEFESIAVVDGASLGLSFMTLDSLTIQDPWPVY